MRYTYIYAQRNGHLTRYISFFFSMQDPIKNVFDTFSKNGMAVELHRRNDDGTLTPASEKDLHVFGARAKFASTAEALKGMSKTEKSKWALDMKEYANELFRNGFLLLK